MVLVKEKDQEWFLGSHKVSVHYGKSHDSTQNNSTPKVFYISWINNNINHNKILLELYSPSFKDCHAANIILLYLARIPTEIYFFACSLIVIKIKQLEVFLPVRDWSCSLMLQVLPSSVPPKYDPAISLQISPQRVLCLKFSRNPLWVLEHATSTRKLFQTGQGLHGTPAVKCSMTLISDNMHKMAPSIRYIPHYPHKQAWAQFPTSRLKSNKAFEDWYKMTGFPFASLTRVR